MSHASLKIHPFNQILIYDDQPTNEEMRRYILMRLDELSNEESVDRLTIAHLREQYNGLRHKIMYREIKSSVEFLIRLPPELSLRCLQDSLPTRYYARRLLELTTVSTRWRDFIVSAKELWVYIDVRASQDDSMATLASFVALSGARPIHLTIWDDPGDEWDHLRCILIQHQRRIQSVHFKQETELVASRRFSIARRVMQSFQHLPISTETHLGDQPSLALYPWQLEFLVETSNSYVLRGLDLPLCSFPKDHRILNQIGSVTTGHGLANVSSILPSMTNLTSIWFRPNEDTKSESISITSPSVIQPFGVPNRLTSLTSFQEFDQLLSSLISSVAITLSSLTVVVSYPHWTSLLGCLSSSANLRELGMEIRGSTSGDTAAPNLGFLKPVLGMKTLSLQVQSSEEPAGNLRSTDTFFGSVIAAFAQIYPGVHSFKLEHYELGRNYTILRKYLESLKELEDLGIWEVTVEQGLQTAPIYLPYLKRLDTEGAFVPYIYAPTLEWVRMAGGEGMATRRFSSILGLYIWSITGEFVEFRGSLNPKNYPSLRSIILDFPSFGIWDWRMPSLPSLRKIKITSENRLDQSATMLCISILYHPCHCPVLDEIELTGFVEWDILMLMLESRNFRTDGIKRISTLKIPMVPTILSAPLESRLRGIYTDRPPNEELSTEAIVEVLCDPETPGCIYCIKNMIPGCKLHLAISHGRFFRLDWFYKEYPEPPSTSNKEPFQWIRQSTVRTEKWKAKWISFGATYRRRKACKKYPHPMTAPWSLMDTTG